MLKQNQTQRQSTKSKMPSVVNRKKSVVNRLSKPKSILLPPSPSPSPPPTSSSTSSLSSGRLSSPSLLPLTPPTPVTEEEYDPTTQLPIGLLRTLLQSPSNLTLDVVEEDEEQADETVYVDRRSYAEKMDFFDNFEEIPDIENVSQDVIAVDVDVDTANAEVKRLPKAVPEDEGKFVDPISGQRISSKSFDAKQKVTKTARLATVKRKTSATKSKPQSKAKPKPEPEHKSKHESTTAQEFQLSDLMITESQTLGSQASELNDLILPDYTEFSEVCSETASHTKEMVDEAAEAVLETFLERVDVKYEDKDKHIDWFALAIDRETPTVQQETKEFLTALIRKVVERSEFRTKDEILAAKLDKRKLLVELAEKCLQFEAEVANNRILERKVVDFLKRKKLINQIKPSKFDAVSKPKYFAALWELEKKLTKETAIRNKFESVKTTLQEEIRKSEKHSKKQIQEFETLVKLKLSGNDLENLNHRILPHIADMREFRKKISATRYKLILLAGTQAELKKQLDEITDPGYGYSVEDFYSLLNKNQELQKKIEERDGSLDKLHSNLQKNIHILAHYTETKDRLNQFVERQRFEFKELRFEQQRLRRHLQNLNMKRLRTRQEIKEMSFKAGLLDKPLLMYDYDKTVQQIEEDKVKIARLRATLATIEHKIKILEESLYNRTIITYSIR